MALEWDVPPRKPVLRAGAADPAQLLGMSTVSIR
ncbi:hypothetical protein JOD54_004485 [Actinokineospora baliensis]|nr:hypothetical protein [Actinokineospora baliensis]